MPFAPAIQYRGDQYLFQGLSSAADSIGQGIDRYHQKQKEKEQQTAALEVLKQYGPKLGLDTSDDGAMLAGVKAFGAANLLSLAGQAKQAQQDQAAAQSVLASSGYTPAQLSMLDGPSMVALAKGKATEADLNYKQALAAEAQAAANARTAAVAQDQADVGILQNLAKGGQKLTPEAYMGAGGANPAMIRQLAQIKTPAASHLGEVVDIRGVPYVRTQEGNLSPLPQPKVASAVSQVQVGGKAYTVGPGNRYFDDQGNPVNFSQPPDPLAAQERRAAQDQIPQLQARIAEDRKAIDAGDGRYPDYLNFFSRQGRIDQTQQALAAAQAKLGSSAQAQPAAAVQAPATAAPKAFDSADAVKAAVRSGELSREQAVAILKQQFGMQ